MTGHWNWMKLLCLLPHPCVGVFTPDFQEFPEGLYGYAPSFLYPRGAHGLGPSWDTPACSTICTPAHIHSFYTRPPTYRHSNPEQVRWLHPLSLQCKIYSFWGKPCLSISKWIPWSNQEESRSSELTSHFSHYLAMELWNLNISSSVSSTLKWE